MDLYNRNFKFLIGGCSIESRDLLVTSVEALDFIFFYTGPNPGGQCVKNMYTYILLFYYIIII